MAPAFSLTGDGLLAWAAASLLVSLRVAPIFAFAPPFTLTGLPPLFRALFGLSLASLLVSGGGPYADVASFSLAELTGAALGELTVGAIFVAAFQIAYAGLYFAGRAVDIQIGFGLASLIDPSTKGQTPLIGTILVYAAAAVFFGLNGHHELLNLLARSLEAAPIGAVAPALSIDRLAGFMSAVFIASLGVAGGAILAVFVADLAIGMLSRTVPQMNVLATGLQVKAVLALLILPVIVGGSAAAFVRLAGMTLDAIPRLL